MTVLISFSVLAIAYFAARFLSDGYANTMDGWAYWIHRHAGRVRKHQNEVGRSINQKWVRTLETGFTAEEESAFAKQYEGRCSDCGGMAYNGHCSARCRSAV